MARAGHPAHRGSISPRAACSQGGIAGEHPSSIVQHPTLNIQSRARLRSRVCWMLNVERLIPHRILATRPKRVTPAARGTSNAEHQTSNSAAAIFSRHHARRRGARRAAFSTHVAREKKSARDTGGIPRTGIVSPANRGRKNWPTCSSSSCLSCQHRPRRFPRRKVRRLCSCRGPSVRACRLRSPS